ncbi:alpha/beta hydrolase family esterase [Daejeonella lutea]|uniref:Polyhydroxybutyrate depolymerase n=1 Tax=Daejeonella lutea TaxID=572036 RepID=A0A1T5A9X2_9SPHI|nr:PHB depolymerase family esterase [Daejeonella lutea]SKB31649.1 polyhydroxybutyrate depolymerase [Daejeonella lutea]
MKTKSLLATLILINIACAVLAQSPKAPGVHTETVKFGGLDRRFMYYIPQRYDEKAKLPVVFFLHGMGASAQIGVNVLGPQYHARADRDKAIVVYPDATSKHWNDKLGGSYPLTDSVDDVGYISSLIDLFIKDFKGDPSRVYVSGSSNGGMMTYRLSVDIPEKIAAIAPFVSSISNTVAEQFPKAQPIPIIITSGTADTVIKWSGGPIRVTRTPSILSGDENVAYWVKRNGASKKAKITTLPDVEPGDKSTVEVQEYKGKYDVILYKIINGYHQHPTLREPGKPLSSGKNMDYNSFERVWDFMLAYKK